eukprot:9481811-Pyramimonas_sp.AAC.1
MHGGLRENMSTVEDQQRRHLEPRKVQRGKQENHDKHKKNLCLHKGNNKEQGEPVIDDTFVVQTLRT